MTLGITSIGLAAIAGVLSILSPCVWPLVPVVMSSAATSGRSGPWFLALGLSTAFGLAGSVLVLLLLNLGLGPEVLRYIAATLLMLLALLLLVPPAGSWVMLQLSRLGSRTGGGVSVKATTGAGQFGVGALLGFVWLPCVGPTLGTAIALASLGQDLMLAFAVMFSFGLGTAVVLIAAGFASRHALMRWRPEVLRGAARGKKLLGWTLLFLALLVFTGVDKVLETMALQILPDWAISI